MIWKSELIPSLCFHSIPVSGLRHGSVPQNATMSDFPNTLPSYELAKERAEPESIKYNSKAVTEQKVGMQTSNRLTL